MKTVHVLLSLFCAVAGCQQNDAPIVSRVDNATLQNSQLARAQQGPIQTVGQISAVATFYGPMPTGVTVSHSGRIFVNFPRWGDPVEFTVAEVVDGKAVPFPNLEFNKLNTDKPSECLISVQSVVIDPQDRLWVLDTGSINMQPILAGGPKLICYDLKTNQEIKRIQFPNTALSTTYLNDVRFNLTLGKEGTAFITDSSDKLNAIIVVDLASGQSFRRLEGDPSTTADQKFQPIVEGQPLLARPKGQPAAYMHMGADGIAISADGGTLYYCPLSSHRIYGISTEALADRNISDIDCAKAVRQLPARDYASDGLEYDPTGHLYLTDYEHNAIHRRNTDGSGDQIIAQDPRMIWPDTMSVAADGYLYFTCNQLNRQPRFHEGQDLRQQPYVLFRTPLAHPSTAGQ